MINAINGKIIERRENAALIRAQGVDYEVIVPVSVLSRLDEAIDSDGQVHLKTYHYFQISPAGGFPLLVGFINEIERDFFMQFIKVSGIGPRAAVKALNQPISEVAKAIDAGDLKYLQTLPGIGAQRAKEVIAKLQGKVGRFGLIKDAAPSGAHQKAPAADWQEEALGVLIQLQYKRPEAQEMIKKSLERNGHINSAEELLNEIYRQRGRS